ncbi:MAG: histidine kinase dimerization/phospho-acceptor domain-containing protein [Candidatus Desulfatibia sp.]|uniref:histidine kinase dimerization/phospho-acceptor domain-containing protein n=1 Tax=Candidatus Desulfatibia sp. TaxID=3101189 RepID=UPI002F2C8902
MKPETRKSMTETEKMNVLKQQKEARNEERLKKLLHKAGVLCHELNQPLQSISGYSDLIIMDLDEGNPFYERMHKIRLQVDKMAQISRKLMSIARYESTDRFKGKIIGIDNASKDLPVDKLSKLISETGS